MEKSQNWSFVEALQAVAEFLGLSNSDQPPIQIDLIERLCRSKQMPIEAFRQFEPTITTRGRDRAKCVRVPVYDGTGAKHSYFDLILNLKGKFKPGKGSTGLFFPGQLPQPGEKWHLVEGVKDAAALIGLGLNAAGLPMSSMPCQHARLFRGVDVILVPDLDSVGRDGSQKTGGILSDIAASVRIARLPGEILKRGGDDVRDVLRRPDGEKLVRDAIELAEAWQPRDKETRDKDGRPEVVLSSEYDDCVGEVVKHLGKLGWQSEWVPSHRREHVRVYERGGAMVEVVTEQTNVISPGADCISTGHARIRPLPAGQIPLRICSSCSLITEKETSDGEIIRKWSAPPKWLVDGIATFGDYTKSLRPLDALISAPTLRPDGTIIQQRGYDAATGLLYRPDQRFPAIPEEPTLEDAKQAAQALLEVITDFEFADDTDRSAWLCLVLSMVGRSAVPGCVPMFSVTATVRGSGKSLLVDAASMIAYGRPAARRPYSGDDDETRKSITATAMEAQPAVLLDNVTKMVGGAALDAALTSLTWSDRVLGSSRTTGDLPLRTVWSVTGNNLRFGSDLARRVLPIRLASNSENPEDRTDFQHPNLLDWIGRNRGRLTVAALTLLRAYFVAGRPEQSGSGWGSFQEFSDVIRGAITWAGLADPLETREAAKDEDSSAAIVRQLIGGLLEMDNSSDGLTVRQLVTQLNDSSMSHRFSTMRDVVSDVATERGSINQRRLGYALRQYKGRIANGFRLVRTLNRTKTAIWKVESVSAGDVGDAGDNPGDLYAGGVCVASEDATHVIPTEKDREQSPASPTSPASDGKPRTDATHIDQSVNPPESSPASPANDDLEWLDQSGL